MKFLVLIFLAIYSVFIAACSSQSAVVRTHSLITYGLDEQRVRIWTYSRILDRGQKFFMDKEIHDGEKIVFEDGTEMVFNHGVLFFNGESRGVVHGNYFFNKADKTLARGFIRTFD